MNSCLVDGEHGVDADVGKLAGHLGVQLGVEGGLGDLDEDVPLLLLGERDLHLVESREIVHVQLLVVHLLDHLLQVLVLLLNVTLGATL